MKSIVTRALHCWGFSDAKVDLIAARENAVYRVQHKGLSYALRLHRRGYRTDIELRSELAWMQAAAQGGLTVPVPVASRSNEFLHHVDSIQVDVLTWLPGQPMSTPRGPLKVKDRVSTFFDLGAAMARLHNVSDAWEQPANFVRCSWDRAGLLGVAPLWDAFWNNPGLSTKEKSLFVNFRAQADADLNCLEHRLDYGLIHADLVSANVMINQGQIALIDFDDGGFGFRLFDIATALLKHQSEPDYGELHDGLIAGYRTERDISTDDLNLFMAIRAVSYVGWNITRAFEEGGEERNVRFINAAYFAVQRYMTAAG